MARTAAFCREHYADYIVGTAHEIPRFTSLHPAAATPSPWTAFGAKGVSEGNTTSTPVCIANAVADALGRSDIRLPLRPCRVAEWIHGGGTAAAPVACGHARRSAGAYRQRLGDSAGDARPRLSYAARSGASAGESSRDATSSAWSAKMHTAPMSRLAPARCAGASRPHVRLSELLPPHAATLEGRVIGPLGAASGIGHIRLAEVPEGTRADYDYEIAISGKVASIGGRMLDGAARAVIGLFFRQLIAATGRAERWPGGARCSGDQPRSGIDISAATYALPADRATGSSPT